MVIDERNQGAKLFFMLNIFLLHQFYLFSVMGISDGGFIDVSIQSSAGGQATEVGGQSVITL